LTVFARLKLMLLLALALAGSAWGDEANREVRLGQIGISFYAVAGQVVQTVLERLGQTVQLQTGSHSEIFPELGSGSLDLLVAALYSGARLYWAVPDYVPVTTVASVEDLKKPGVIERMQTRIQATKPDSGLSMGSQRIMLAYGLETSGYKLLTSNHHDWQAYFESNYNAGEWFVMPYFRPNFLNRMARMRRLEEPRDLLGKENRAVLVAHERYLATAPDAVIQVLRRVELDLDAIAEMDYMVRVDGLTARAAAQGWMATNAPRVESWFEVQ
jgi:glycine betaine/proline transport system substrate-binding protein